MRFSYTPFLPKTLSRFSTKNGGFTTLTSECVCVWCLRHNNDNRVTFFKCNSNRERTDVRSVCPGQVFSAVSPESKLTIPYTAWGNKIRRVCTLIHCYRVDVVQWERETDSDSAWG